MSNDAITVPSGSREHVVRSDLSFGNNDSRTFVHVVRCSCDHRFEGHGSTAVMAEAHVRSQFDIHAEQLLAVHPAGHAIVDRLRKSRSVIAADRLMDSHRRLTATNGILLSLVSGSVRH